MTSPGHCPNRCDSPAAESVALLAAWRLGDRNAGKALLFYYDRAVARFFRNKVYRESDIIPLVGQVFQALRDGGEAVSCFRASLYRTAYRILRDYLPRGTRSDIDVTTISAEALGTRTSRDISHRYRRLLDALRRLPLEQHIALELTHWENLPLNELASALGLPPAEAAHCLRAATARLQATRSAYFDPECVDTKLY